MLIIERFKIYKNGGYNQYCSSQWYYSKELVVVLSKLSSKKVGNIMQRLQLVEKGTYLIFSYIPATIKLILCCDVNYLPTYHLLNITYDSSGQ